MRGEVADAQITSWPGTQGCHLWREMGREELWCIVSTSSSTFEWMQAHVVPCPNLPLLSHLSFLPPSYCPQDNWWWDQRGDEVNLTRGGVNKAVQLCVNWGAWHNIHCLLLWSVGRWSITLSHMCLCLCLDLASLPNFSLGFKTLPSQGKGSSPASLRYYI